MRKEDIRKEEIPHVIVMHREDWRNWLEENHEKEKKVALVSYKKHTGKPSISHRTAMDEAICFGWIDTTIKRLDDEKYLRHFVRRGDKANWSNNTLRYAKELMKAGKMAPAGIKRYKEGLLKRPHDYGRKKNPDTPEDLRKTLKREKGEESFTNLAPSYKRMYIHWIERAKRKETREKRIKEVVKAILSKKNVFRLSKDQK